MQDWIAAGLASRADSQEGAEPWLRRAEPHIPAELRKPLADNGWLQTYGRIFWDAGDEGDEQE